MSEPTTVNLNTIRQRLNNKTKERDDLYSVLIKAQNELNEVENEVYELQTTLDVCDRFATQPRKRRASNTSTKRQTSSSATSKSVAAREAWYRSESFANHAVEYAEVLRKLGGTATTREVARALIQHYPKRWKNELSATASVSNVMGHSPLFEKIAAAKYSLIGQTSGHGRTRSNRSVVTT